MKKYEVRIPVEGWEAYEIKAKNKEDAIKKVDDGLGERVDSEIGWSWDNYNYDVEEIK